MLSPLCQDHGGSVSWPQTSSCSSSPQGLHRPLRCHPPPISGSSVGPNPTYYHAVYDVRVEQYREVPFIGGGCSYGVHTRRSSMALVTGGADSTVPPVRRRGGLVDHRDVILAHQAHKLHNTPQARRKQWE
ncbi:putative voltage-dependent P/Q-type calcium channel subunit alpha-1A [Scophthalmus maximus]|nr:putative voltage-dependent P/Q-type calcium channel subunit alpha-1A [Scophthalmus maximus]